MIRIISAELTKLRTLRAAWLTGLACLAFVVVISGAQAALTPQLGPVNMGFIDSSMRLVNTLVMVFGVLAATWDIQSGMDKISFLSFPSKKKALWGKLTAVGISTTGLMVVIFGAFFALVYPIIVMRESFVFVSTSFFLQKTVGWTVSMVVCAIWGVAVGTLLRNTAASIVVVVLWPVFEGMVNMVPGIGEDLYHFLPMSSLEVLYNYVSNIPGQGILDSWEFSSLVLIVFTFVLLKITNTVNAHRDF